MSPILLLWLAYTDHGYGPVDPVRLPVVHVTRHDGQRMTLADALGPDRVAVQFIFTGCRFTCPRLGQLFRSVDRVVNAGRLVSITVDPAADTPGNLAAWRRQFGASDRWLALRPDPAALPALLRAFGQTDPTPAAHSLQVFFVENGRYVARTTDLPRSAVIAAALEGTPFMAGRTPVVEAGGSAPQAPCANCHGASWEGAREGKLQAPPLRGLSSVQARRGGPPRAYDRESFCQALRTGVDPAGVVLGAVMPRYQLSAAACSALWDLVR